MTGEAPYQIAFRWIYGPPMPVGLDPDERGAWNRQRIAEIFAGRYPDTGSPAQAPDESSWDVEPDDNPLHDDSTIASVPRGT